MIEALHNEYYAGSIAYVIRAEKAEKSPRLSAAIVGVGVSGALRL